MEARPRGAEMLGTDELERGTRQGAREDAWVAARSTVCEAGEDEAGVRLLMRAGELGRGGTGDGADPPLLLLCVLVMWAVMRGEDASEKPAKTGWNRTRLRRCVG